MIVTDVCGFVCLHVKYSNTIYLFLGNKFFNGFQCFYFKQI